MNKGNEKPAHIINSKPDLAKTPNPFTSAKFQTTLKESKSKKGKEGSFKKKIWLVHWLLIYEEITFHEVKTLFLLKSASE